VFKTEAHTSTHVDIELVKGRDFTMLVYSTHVERKHSDHPSSLLGHGIGLPADIAENL